MRATVVNDAYTGGDNEHGELDSQLLAQPVAPLAVADAGLALAHAVLHAIAPADSFAHSFPIAHAHAHPFCDSHAQIAY